MSGTGIPKALLLGSHIPGSPATCCSSLKICGSRMPTGPASARLTERVSATRTRRSRLPSSKTSCICWRTTFGASCACRSALSWPKRPCAAAHLRRGYRSKQRRLAETASQLSQLGPAVQLGIAHGMSAACPPSRPQRRLARPQSRRRLGWRALRLGLSGGLQPQRRAGALSAASPVRRPARPRPRRRRRPGARPAVRGSAGRTRG